MSDLVRQSIFNVRKQLNNSPEKSIKRIFKAEETNLTERKISRFSQF
ncbi:hypothetical protein [Chryseobacterium sp. MP_3.2]|nr:hypothetical protein [Chryseobacterium sp. MP_3.2]